jgi:hypothetical protein
MNLPPPRFLAHLSLERLVAQNFSHILGYNWPKFSREVNKKRTLSEWPNPCTIYIIKREKGLPTVQKIGLQKSSKKLHRTTTKATCKLTSTPTIPHVKKYAKWVLEKVVNNTTQQQQQKL